MRVPYAAAIALSILTASAVTLSTTEWSRAAEGVVDDTKQNNLPALASPAAAAACKAAWEAADLNKNGVLDPDEVLVYNAKLKAEHKPLLTDTNINEAGFLKNCESLTAHE